MLTFLKKAARLTSRFAPSLLLLGGLSALAAPANAGTVTLTASARTATLPDGAVVPMWGLSCNDGGTDGVTCAAANASAGGNWSPVVITVDSSVTTSLTITLQNTLSFAGGNIPTSLVVLGQVGGGLGTTATTAASPTHAEQGTTWPVVNSGATNAPPLQLPRVQSFATEVAAGGSATYTFSTLRPGTYLIQSGTHPSIQVPMGLYGVLVVTDKTARQAYPGNANALYDADLPVVLGEIDPVQNAAVDTAVRTSGFSELAPWVGLTGQCGDPAVHTCYPPAINYSPRYYLVNGVSFDRGNIAASSASVLAPATPDASVVSTRGKVLLRYVNAGLRMHVPTVVGLQATVLAEDGNVLPGNPRVQGEVFLAAGKTHDVTISPKVVGGNYTAASYPIFDRQLSLTTNSQSDGGMQAYLNVAGGVQIGVGSTVGSQRTLSGDANKQYYCQINTPLQVSDPNTGVLAGVVGANGVSVVSKAGLPNGSSLQFNTNGTFTYTPPPTGTCAGAFTFAVNGAATHTATIYECDATMQQDGCVLTGPPVVGNDAFASTNAKQLSVAVPGILRNDTDPAGKVLKVDLATVAVPTGSPMTLSVNADGSFSAQATAPGTYTFTYNVRNTQQVAALAPATVSVTFPTGSGLTVHAYDNKHPTDAAFDIKDYRWIIEEDRTFWHDPKCQVNHGTYGQTPTNVNGTPALDSFGHACPDLPIESLGYNFYSANMPVVAVGCTGTVSCQDGQTLLGTPAVCDVGNGMCRTNAQQRTPLSPADVALDPLKHYFITIMSADGINPSLTGAGAPVCSVAVDAQGNCPGAMRQFNIALDCPTAADFAPGTGTCGHNMSGAQIAPAFNSHGLPITPSVSLPMIETPLPPANISVLVYEDDFPLNGENDAGGGVDILANKEPGLPDFQIILLDQAAQLGDNVGQMTYDMFNQPLSNALAGTIDPFTHADACPITSNVTDPSKGTTGDNIAPMIITCPKYESDHVTMSPLAGQAVISNLPGGLYEIQAIPNADRIARGEEWLQTNTLDGGKPHEAFIRPGEPRQFQEFGPGGFHSQIGFANPKTINDRRHNTNGTGLCDPAPKGGGLTCNSTLTGHVHGNHMSRTPDERTYDTSSYDAFAWSACYVSVGIPDEEDIAFAKCDGEGNFTMTNMPNGNFKVAVFDQWNDIMLDGLVSAIQVSGNTDLVLTATQWRTNMYTRAYMDLNGNGIPDRDSTGADLEPGLATIAMNIRYRDGEVAFKNTTDSNGYATWNEVFPLMAWLVVEPDYARYKSTGVHVVYDAGGPADCSAIAQTVYGGTGHCSKTAAYLAGTAETVSLPSALRVPGARYCLGSDCDDPSDSIKNGTYYNAGGDSGPTVGLSSGRIDPPQSMEAWQGLLGQHSFLDFGFKPYVAHENGGIRGSVTYASTRPFDDPGLLFQNQWEPGVPNVTINLYKKGVAADGTQTLQLVDTLQSESWDAYAQGFRTDGTGTGALVKAAVGTANEGFIPNMNCPGQDPSSGFFATLQGSKMWLDTKDSVTGKKHALAYNAQFKCFDGWGMLNQIQPATYDGHYVFPSVTDRSPATGRPTTTNCTICVANPDDGNPMLPTGEYVVEVVPPAGFEVVKEEDKNILMGDQFVAPVTQQFAGLGSVFILPDQATLAANFNGNNAQNPTNNLGVSVMPRGVLAMYSKQLWPCVGETRIVPDYNSLYPAMQQTAPFAGATRALCDRKEITLSDQMGANTDFFLFTQAHKAARFYGVMSDDMASEFDPFSPAFGEKFGPPNLPVGMRNFAGDEIIRVYADQWGLYNGLFPSSWEVNPPTPSGYAPQMAIACMNDQGPILDQDLDSPTYGQMIIDPAYSPAYSNFCYEHPYLPGVLAHMDTPVTPVQAFADHYNLPDAEYPDGTPVIKRADFVGHQGPWSPTSVGVNSVTVGTRGTYSAAPTVSFSGGAGSGAAALATMRVASIHVTSSGTYTAVPTVTITDPVGAGSGATATACLGITSTQINFSPTIPWTPANAVVTFNGTATQQTRGFNVNGAVATAHIAGTGTGTARVVDYVTVTAAGCYSTLPTTITLANAQLFASTTAAITNGSGASWTSGVGSITVNNAGSGYTQATVTVSAGASTATATASLSLDAVTMTNAGSAYTAAPTVAFTGSGGGSATANLGAGQPTAALVLTAFGDRSVQNPVYTGPNAAVAPYNARTITRHYGFGTQCSASDAANHVGACVAESSVLVLGPGCRELDVGAKAGCVKATVNSWSDTSINATLPSGIPACVVQQHGEGQSLCGEVVIVAGNGKQSIDGVTVTLGGKAPTIVTPTSPSRDAKVFGDLRPKPLQTAIDNAKPGDLIIVEAGTYRENLIMWKPVRLQGVGAGSVIINADNHEAEHLSAWRRQMGCLFGLTTKGAPNTGNTIFDEETIPASSAFTCPNTMYFRADRLPFEGFVGWDTSSNGNLMQLIIEPSIMGAYEGAGITVVGRGVNQTGVTGGSSADPWGQSTGGGPYADGAKYLSTNQQGTQLVANPWASSECNNATVPTTNGYLDDYYTGNFDCNPSTIDGLSINNSSEGGGGIFIHGWNHHLQVANNRISANAGTFAGGINLGNGEIPPAFVLDDVSCGSTGLTPAPLCPPIPVGTIYQQTNSLVPYRFEDGVRIHHNQIIDNASIGDALFSYVPSGSGGVTISGGADNYEIDHNWIAANLTAGDGAGIAHIGMSENGSIHNNFILFNEANNPSLEVDGGGILISGGQEDRVLPDGTECGGATDSDCPPGLGFGAGHHLLVDSNLILGNSAAYGSGGGIRLRQVNGSEIASFPKTPDNWFDITLTNNIIVNNVAGWDGGGISLQDTLKAVIANNTVVSNDTTSSAGVLFKTMSAMMGASPQPGCVPTSDAFLPPNPKCLSGGNGPHMPQPAGLVTMQNTPNLMASMAKWWNDATGEWQATGSIICPAGYGYGVGNDVLPTFNRQGVLSNAGDASLLNGRCLLASIPKIVNTLFWQNRSFHVAIVDNTGQPIANQGSRAPNGTGLYSQQNMVALLPTLNQTATGQCVAPNAPGVITDFPNPELYWDVGVRMDQWGTHGLSFSTATVAGGYTLDAVATANLASASSATFTDTVGNNNGADATGTASVGRTATFRATIANATGTNATATAVLGTRATATAVSGGTRATATATRGTQATATLTLGTGANAGRVGAVTNLVGGSGYQAAPTATISAPTGCTINGTSCVRATATTTLAANAVSAVTITNAGRGYTAAPTITFTAPGLASIAVTNAGSSYQTAPAVTFAGGGGTGATATATVVNGVVTQITLNNRGSGYTSAPTVTLAASTGISSVTVTNAGTGYQTAPAVTFAGGGGTGAAATATVANGVVTGISLTNYGTGYTSNPTVTLALPGIASVTVTNGGTNYVTAPTITFAGGGGTGAAATANVTNGVVTGITMTNYGAGYTSAPTVNFANGRATGIVTQIAVVNGGANYAVAPVLTVAAPVCTINGTTCVQAAATAVLNGTVVGSVNITNPGAGYGAAPGVTAPDHTGVTSITLGTGGTQYVFAPTVTFTGGAGTGATATANISNGAVTGYTVTAAGSGYTSAPTVVVSQGHPTGIIKTVAIVSGGSNYSAAPVLTFDLPPCVIDGIRCIQATATASITSGAVSAVTITNAGAGYPTPPAITVSNEVFSAAGVASITVLSGGTGFIATPTVTLDPPGCTLNGTNCVQATATAHLTGGVVTSVTVGAKGAGYTSSPWVSFTGGGLTPNTALTTANGGAGVPFVVTAKNSIFSDALNAQFASNTNAVDATNVIPTAAPILGQYCNGARVPPEECNQNLGIVYPGTCHGYNVPAGVAEAPGTFPLFVFDNIQATATTDEGKNWINMVYGPLTLTRPTGTPDATALVSTPMVAMKGGAYTITGGSPVIDAGQVASAYTNHDFFGNARGTGAGWDIGAIELPPTPVNMTITKTAAAATVYRGANVTYTIRVINNDFTKVIGAKVVDTLTQAQFASVSWTCAASTTNGSSCVSGSSTASSSGTTSIAGTLVGGGLIDVAAGDTVTYTVTGVVTSNATLGAFNNTASFTLPAGFVQATGVSATATAAVTVQARPPVLSSVSPTSGNKGSTVGVTLNGTYLTGATAVAVTPISGAAVTCGTIVVVSDTQVTASCALPIGTAAGLGTIGVTTTGGTATTAFTVTTPSFSLTSTTPSSATRGNGSGGANNVSVTLAGTGLSAVSPITAVTLTNTASGATISCTVGATTDTSIAATCPLASNAATGAGTISATTQVGESNALAFTVNAGTPTITSVSPSAVVNGFGLGTATYRETVTGTYLTGANSMAFTTNNNVLNGTCGAVTVVNDTTVYASCGATALSTTTRGLQVVTPGGTATGVNVAKAANVTAPGTLTIPRTGNSGSITFTAGGGLLGVSAVASSGGMGVACVVQPGGTDTSVTAICTGTGTVAATNRTFTLTLGLNNSGQIRTGNVSVTQL